MTRTTKLTSKIYCIASHFAENKNFSDFREYEYVNIMITCGFIVS